eukprot:464468-Ditylum_brightwellii.AAC.1
MNQCVSSAQPSCPDSSTDVTVDSSSHPNKKWKWDPASLSHRCNIRKITHDELTEEFGTSGLPPLYHSPIVIIDDNKTNGQRHNQRFAEMTAAEKIVEYFPPNFLVTLS